MPSRNRTRKSAPGDHLLGKIRIPHIRECPMCNYKPIPIDDSCPNCGRDPLGRDEKVWNDGLTPRGRQLADED